MPPPYPKITNINQSVDLLRYANTVTEGWMAHLFLVASAVILFILMQTKGYKTSDSMAVAFVISLVLGSFLWALGMVQGQILMIFVIGAIACTLWSVFDSR